MNKASSLVVNIDIWGIVRSRVLNRDTQGLVGVKHIDCRSPKSDGSGTKLDPKKGKGITDILLGAMRKISRRRVRVQFEL